MKQKIMHDGKQACWKFTKGETVYAESFTGSGPRWVPGVILAVTGPLSYLIKLANGNTVRRHVDSVKERITETNKENIGPCSTSEGDWPGLKSTQEQDVVVEPPTAEMSTTTSEPRISIRPEQSSQLASQKIYTHSQARRTI